MNRNRMFNGILLIGAMLGIFMIAAIETRWVGGDYKHHIRVVEQIEAYDLLHPIQFLETISYPIWHVLAFMVMTVFGCSGKIAAAVVSGGCAASIFVGIFVSLRLKHREEGFAAVLSMSVLAMLVAPIYLFFFNENLYLGQDSPNVWHNPTLLMVKAVAFPFYVGFVSLMSRMLSVADNAEADSRKMPWGWLCVLAVGLVATNFAKPCFIQIFFPAFCILALLLVAMRGKAAVSPVVRLSLVFLPAIVLAGIQYVMLFGEGSVGKVEVAFLKYWRHTTPNVAVSLLLVSLFPLLMLGYSLKSRKFGWADVLVWLMFLVGLSQKALLIEEGRRMWHGNMTWGFILAVFFVWYFAIDKFMSLLADNALPRRRAWLATSVAIFLLHAVSGVWYLWRLLILSLWQ